MEQDNGLLMTISCWSHAHLFNWTSVVRNINRHKR